ncbi:disease resistance protein RGA2-like [Papaver somniferum]|uniref:disease resistance protein RGA2-like n=1 Tax=Papaver somniferum TaxID=3469 RepID=UPI000E6FF1E8|nr:disease resistance protein RGA2-like [Papaver somniferum]
MALEKVLVSSSIKILIKLGFLAAKQIGMSQDVKDKLKTLKNTLETIEAVTLDAERKQVEDASVRVWLTRLRSVAYDVDDLLDELSYEVMRRCEKQHSQIDKVTDFFPSKKLADKIHAINKRLRDIARDKARYMLVETINIPSTSHNQCINQRNRLTSSFLGDQKIVGREDDKSHIVNMLLMPSSEKISVISIVGMGGLGKTTLAQMVYKDDRIEDYFDAKIWVCVSKEFDVYKTLQNDVKTNKLGDIQTCKMHHLVHDLARSVSGNLEIMVLGASDMEDVSEVRRLQLVVDEVTSAALPDSITCIENFSMLETNNCQMLEALPKDLGALTRLRSLDLKGTRIAALPESCISKLCNLEMVDLGYMCQLPREIKNWPKIDTLDTPE